MESLVTLAILLPLAGTGCKSMTPGQLSRVQTDKGEYLAAVKKTAGRPT